MKTFEVSDATFQAEVLEQPDLTVVDFWAPWCGPCRMIAPIIEELAAEYAGKVRFAKLNTDDNYETSSRYGIRGIPTLGFFLDGKLADTVVGVVPKSQLKTQIDRWMEAVSAV